MGVSGGEWVCGCMAGGVWVHGWGCLGGFAQLWDVQRCVCERGQGGWVVGWGGCEELQGLEGVRGWGGCLASGGYGVRVWECESVCVWSGGVW